MNTEAPLRLEQIHEARERLAPVILSTPLVPSWYLSRILGREILLKLENLQETGSFKVRGALNRMVRLTEEERARGVVAASAGNHAQGVAWAAARLGIRAVIVMPEEVSIRKLLGVREYDAEIVLTGRNFDDAYAHAVRLAQETGRVLIPAFDDPLVMAGQGTIGLEIAHALDERTTVVVPVGGGGLIAGVATAVKSVAPAARVVGVQTEHCASMIRSLDARQPVSVDAGPTLADGIAVKQPGALTYPVVRDRVDEVVAVDEEGISGAIVTLIERAGLVVEGAGAVPAAALLEGKIPSRGRVVLILSGGNIEIHTLDRILQRGAIRMGRLLRIEVDLPDVPGALWKLTGIVATLKANIVHIVHDRLALENPIQVSRVELNLETRGPDHIEEIVDALGRAGYTVRRIR